MAQRTPIELLVSKCCRPCCSAVCPSMAVLSTTKLCIQLKLHVAVLCPPMAVLSTTQANTLLSFTWASLVCKLGPNCNYYLVNHKYAEF
jgi:hypothetical protein